MLLFKYRQSSLFLLNAYAYKCICKDQICLKRYRISYFPAAVLPNADFDSICSIECCQNSVLHHSLQLRAFVVIFDWSVSFF